jgi:hypothetical protein
VFVMVVLSFVCLPAYASLRASLFSS